MDHLFFTIGNGYKWENGQLVEKFDSRYPEDAALQAERSDPWGTRVRNRDHREMCLEFKGQCYFRTPSGHIGRYLYSGFGEYSALCRLPDDIQPDWLEAAKVALKYARSNRMRITPKQRVILASVATRIKELEKLRNPALKRTCSMATAKINER